MKSLRLFSGAALAGAITLSHAAVALAAAGTTGTTSTTASSTASAAGENTPIDLGSTSTTAHAASSSGGSLLRTIIGLLIVIAVIYGVSIILRRVKRGSGSKAKGSALRPVATLPLGSGRSVQLVRAGSEFLLLGVAEHGVTPLGRYTEAEALAAGLELPADEATRSYPEDDPSSSGRVLDLLRRMTVRS